jgi:hypothetical protein
VSEETDQTPDEKRLAEVRAKRSALAAERDAREQAEAVAKQLAAEERGLRDDEAIAAAVEKHGAVDQKIRLVHTDLGVVIVKRPHHILFRRYQESDNSSAEELEKLVLPNVVYPTRAEVEHLFQELPATLTRCGNAIAVLAGVRVKEVTGK